MNDKVIDIWEWRRPRKPGEPYCAIPLMVTPTQNEKNEWACVAGAAYKAQYNEIGHTFSVAAALPNGAQMTIKQFDELQSNYRQWLSCGKVTLADGRTVQLVQNP
jgi:hypothetical protein